MNSHILSFLALASLAAPAFALDGQVAIHDPSTVMLCDQKYYVFGTSGTALVSDDGWTWHTAARASRTGMAPDLIHLGDRYYQYIAANPGGMPRAEITMISSKSLDPNSPDYKWEDGGIVCSTDGVEDCNGIDPGAFLDPNDGKLWLTYGSYLGYIRVIELNPKTGKPLDPPAKPLDIASNMEATTLIFHDGWYYLLGTHGSCCRGSDSHYNIRVGRSRKVTGPYLDDEGLDLAKGGGKLFCGTGGRVIGPGHFGLLTLADGIEKFSLHYEADLDRGGASVLDIRPLLWKDAWPLAGDNLREGTYEIESQRTGTALELAIPGIPVGGGGGGRGGGGRGGGPPIPNQDAATVAANWPDGDIPVHMATYMLQAQQKWTFTPVPNAGGYPGAPYFKITIAGTNHTLAATPDGELVALPQFSNRPEQLWRIDQLSDASYRIMPKAVPNATQPMALTAIGASSPTLATYDPKSTKQRWQLKAP